MYYIKFHRILASMLFLVCGSMLAATELSEDIMPQDCQKCEGIYCPNEFRDFGGMSVDKALFDYIAKILKPGQTLLELGSGWGTGEFAKLYTVYSVEHDPRWVGLYNSHYISAPLKNYWYDVEILKRELPAHYDLILVDGPPGGSNPLGLGRIGFYYNLSLFNTNVPIIFDDVERPGEYLLMLGVADKLRKPFQIFAGGASKKFGVIL